MDTSNATDKSVHGLPRYAAALISVSIAVLTAITQAPSGASTEVTVIQVAAIAASAIGTYLLPILEGAKWEGALKTGVAIAAAALTALAPLIVPHQSFTPHDGVIVALAVLNAIGVEAGVNARVDARQS